jgi:CO/xanthine dehydrogenase Mo-binding subunit
MIPPAIETNPRLGTWLRVTDDPGHRVVEVSLGKVELGQGILTSLAQVAADGLALPLSHVRVRAAHTGGPDQGLTAGSLSLTQSTPALAHLGAVVRGLTGWTPDVPLPSYVERIADLDPDTDLSTATPSTAGPRSLVGTDEPRLDLPDKVLGRPRYLTDLRPAGLLHGRVLRPPSAAASLRSVPDDWSSPGVRLVCEGSFLGVVGEREDDVDRALTSLAEAATWDERDSLPDESDLSSWLRSAPAETTTLHDDPVGETTHTASYSKPYLAHASIAPSCGMAQWSTRGEADSVHVWSHTQGVHPLRAAIAQALDLPRDRVSVEHVENAGCYGHNPADDAAYDAVLLARSVPGRPVLTRWTRRDELSWGPLSPAMTGTVSARLVGDRIDGWTYDVWGQGHGGRPGYAGQPGLLGHAHATRTPLPPSGDPPHAAGHGTLRNAVPLYDVGLRRIAGHRVTEPAFRTSSMRSLGSFFNGFAIECFMDELALAAGVDPVEFRLAHLSDPRARAVLSRAASAAGWGSDLAEDHGRGIAFARYKDKGAWCAVVAEVAAGTSLTVERLTVVADLGLVVNPDGARNQLSGGAVQATSWTTTERVRFDRRRITSGDWESYPILRFGHVPSVDVHLIDSDEPPLGAGECAQGPTAAAIANAVHAAIGVRVRDLPLTTEAIQRTIEEES